MQRPFAYYISPRASSVARIPPKNRLGHQQRRLVAPFVAPSTRYICARAGFVALIPSEKPRKCKSCLPVDPAALLERHVQSRGDSSCCGNRPLGCWVIFTHWAASLPAFAVVTTRSSWRSLRICLFACRYLREFRGSSLFFWSKALIARSRTARAPYLLLTPPRGKVSENIPESPLVAPDEGRNRIVPLSVTYPVRPKSVHQSPPSPDGGQNGVGPYSGGSPFPLAYRVFATVGSNPQRGRPRIVICRRGLRNGWESGFSEKSFHACDIRPGDSQPAQRRPRVVPVMVTHQKRGVSPPRRPHHILAE